MKLFITHKTTYRYESPISYGLQHLRLTPKNRMGQTVLAWEINIEGGTRELEFHDHHNNHVVLASLNPDAQELVISASGTVETSNTSGITGTHQGHVPLWLFKRSTDLTRPGRGIRKLVSSINREGDEVSRLHTLSALIAEKVTYTTGYTETETRAEDALNNGAGVCQDHAQIFISAARLLGFGARYVSGYLMLNDRVDQTATHAWAEIHVPNLGWVGFDISNQISPDERYVPVATGLDYADAAPISGMRFGDSRESMIVSVQVQQ